MCLLLRQTGESTNLRGFGETSQHHCRIQSKSGVSTQELLASLNVRLAVVSQSRNSNKTGWKALGGRPRNALIGGSWRSGHTHVTALSDCHKVHGGTALADTYTRDAQTPPRANGSPFRDGNACRRFRPTSLDDRQVVTPRDNGCPVALFVPQRPSPSLTFTAASLTTAPASQPSQQRAVSTSWLPLDMRAIVHAALHDRVTRHPPEQGTESDQRLRRR